jgi:hypothetical protein
MPKGGEKKNLYVANEIFRTNFNFLWCGKSLKGKQQQLMYLAKRNK